MGRIRNLAEDGVANFGLEDPDVALGPLACVVLLFEYRDGEWRPLCSGGWCTDSADVDLSTLTPYIPDVTTADARLVGRR